MSTIKLKYNTTPATESVSERELLVRKLGATTVTLELNGVQAAALATALGMIGCMRTSDAQKFVLGVQNDLRERLHDIGLHADARHAMFPRGGPESNGVLLHIIPGPDAYLTAPFLKPIT